VIKGPLTSFERLQRPFDHGIGVGVGDDGAVLAIRAARLFDGVSAAAVLRPVVLVRDGVIVAVQAGAPPSSAHVADLGDATLLPGLVDGHVHLVLDASDDAVGRIGRVDDEELLRGARSAAATALAAGITTIRDLGDRGYVAVRLRDSRDASLPEILAAGPPLTTPRGHCWFLGGEAAGVEGVRAAVRDRVANGVDVIKVMATGGEITPGTRPYESQYGLPELRAIAEEAHRAGLPATAHAHGAPGIAAAAAAGFDSIEHATFLTASGAQSDPAVLDALVRSGTVVSATLGWSPDAPLSPRVAALGPVLDATFRRTYESGVKLIVTSDCGINPTKPHDVLPYGAEMFLRTGAAPVEALRAVTSAAADACRVGDRKGRLAPGYEADLVAVAGDPLADLAALRAVVAVFRAGIRVR
jgi:imidazolonepropionase-like amidohydrolase